MELDWKQAYRWCAGEEASLALIDPFWCVVDLTDTNGTFYTRNCFFTAVLSSKDCLYVSILC